jgi:multidrug resistance efflux pump
MIAPRLRAAAGALALALTRCSSGGPPATVVVRGTVEGRDITVRSETAGRVVTARTEEGDTVQAGQELVRLDQQELEARLVAAQAGRDAVRARLELLRGGTRPQEMEQARSEVDKARAALKRAEDDRQRAADLFKLGSIAEDKLRAAEAGARIAAADLRAAEQRLSLLHAGPRPEELTALEANLREAEAQIGLIQVQLDRAVIRSPIGGVVTRKAIELGEVVTPGTVICTVTDPVDLKVTVYLSQRQLAGVHVNQTVDIRSEVAPEKAMAGRVRSIAATAEFVPRDVDTPEDRALEVFAVRVGVREAAPEIKPGLGVSVSFRPDGRGP